jgi:hypothetical protein
VNNSVGLPGPLGIPAGGEQQEHGVIALELGLDLSVLNAVRDRFAVTRDAPLPARRAAGCYQYLKQARSTLFHRQWLDFGGETGAEILPTDCCKV